MTRGDEALGDPPRITIVTPSYQQGRYLEQTIRSVLDQGWPALEYFVLDGGSTDGSAEIVRRYDDRLAGWASQPDGGQVAIFGQRPPEAVAAGRVCRILQVGSLVP